MKALILCGGKGVRLFPLSKGNFPKQFLKIGGDLSLFQRTLRRTLRYLKLDDVFIITGKRYEDRIKSDIKEILGEEGLKTLSENLVLEPAGRNTFPAILLGVSYILSKKKVQKGETLLVLPSDHLIEPEEKFFETLGYTEKLVSENFIVTFGVKPYYPETRYGYIKVGEKVSEHAFKVEAFVEKPGREKAESYVKSGNYYWNSGMFAFSVDTLFGEVEKITPGVYEIVKEGNYKRVLANFRNLPATSIDYAIMEKTDKAVVIPLGVKWSDIGNWEGIYEMLEKDGDENIIVGDALCKDVFRSLIWGGKRSIIVIGVEDLIVVDGEDALLIAKKGKSGEIKKLIDQLAT